MAITIVSVSDNLLLELNDVAGKYLNSADRVLDMVMGAVVGTETTWQFQRIQAGYYALQDYSSRYGLLTGSSPYTEPVGVSASRFYAGGPAVPNIRVTTGNTSDAQIAVTGVQVDFRALMNIALERISTHWGLQAQDQNGDTALAVNMLDKVRYMQRQWRGAFSV